MILIMKSFFFILCMLFVFHFNVDPHENISLGAQAQWLQGLAGLCHFPDEIKTLLETFVLVGYPLLFTGIYV